MELGDSPCHISQCRYRFRSIFVDEQEHGRDEEGQPRRQLGGALRRYGARAGRVEHEADSIGTGIYCGIDVLFTREAADLDAGAAKAGHGGPS
jgi:hypothetical protein